MTALRDLIVQHRIHQTFWCINPNSGDTGGLLLDDWKSWDEQKYALLKPALWQHGGKFVSLDHEVRSAARDPPRASACARCTGTAVATPPTRRRPPPRPA
jgi:hypothetical protein